MTSCSLTRIEGLLRVRVAGEGNGPFYRTFTVSPSISLLSMQVPPEPMDLSSGDHPHCEQHGPKKRSEGEASSQEGVQAMRRQVNQPEA
jgi:hypothetical protein